MLSVHQVSLSFGGSDLFKGISFQVNPGDRIGLVGRNGAGKSTLLKLIAGRYKPDTGKISYPSDFSIGFLTQDMPPAPNASVWEEAASSFVEIKRLEAEIESMTGEMGTRTDYESDAYMDLLERFHHAQERYQHIGGYTYQADLERVLLGLGFKATDFHQPLNSFSGGWQMRVELAKILLQHHDVLLLDEPTNHLDIESILWLEEFLAESNQAIILVSHDRTFLRELTRATLWIDRGMVRRHERGFEDFEAWRDKTWDEEDIARHKMDRKIKAEARWAVEGISARRKRNMGRVRALQDLRTERAAMIRRQGAAALSLESGPMSGKKVIEAKGISKTYGGKDIVRNFSLTVQRRDRIAFVGPNGVGKTTLIKSILGLVKYNSGTIEVNGVDINGDISYRNMIG